MTDNPHLTPQRTPEDADAALRPKTLAEFVGQAAAKDNLRVFIESARSRREAMDHVLFFGPSFGSCGHSSRICEARRRAFPSNGRPRH